MAAKATSSCQRIILFMVALRCSSRSTRRKSARLPVRQSRYPHDYRAALACSVFLYPLACRRALRPAFPCRKQSCSGRPTGLPRSASLTGSGRFCLDAGGRTSTEEEGVTSVPDHVPFGHSVRAACAVSAMTAREWQFRCLNRAIHSELPTGSRLPVVNLPRGWLTSPVS